MIDREKKFKNEILSFAKKKNMKKQREVENTKNRQNEKKGQFEKKIIRERERHKRAKSKQA